MAEVVENLPLVDVRDPALKIRDDPVPFDRTPPPCGSVTFPLRNGGRLFTPRGRGRDDECERSRMEEQSFNFPSGPNSFANTINLWLECQIGTACFRIHT
jgi:hypothetical protein